MLCEKLLFDKYFWFKYDLEVLCTKFDHPGFEPMVFRSWQYISFPWDIRLNLWAISDFILLCYSKIFRDRICNLGCICLTGRLPKLPSLCYSNGPGTLDNLSSNKEIEHYTGVTQAKCCPKCVTEQNVTQQNVTQQNVTQLNVTQQNVTQQNVTQQNVTQLNFTWQSITGLWQSTWHCSKWPSVTWPIAECYHCGFDN